MLPDLPVQLLQHIWRPRSRADRPKINAAVASIKCIFSSLCAIHLQEIRAFTRAEIHKLCESKYRELVANLKQRYPTAVAAQFLLYSTSKRKKLMTGQQIYRLAKQVRAKFLNSYNDHWLGSLDEGVPPSGHDWDWVRMRVLVILYRELKKNSTNLPENQGC